MLCKDDYPEQSGVFCWIYCIILFKQEWLEEMCWLDMKGDGWQRKQDKVVLCELMFEWLSLYSEPTEEIKWNKQSWEIKLLRWTDISPVSCNVILDHKRNCFNFLDYMLNPPVQKSVCLSNTGEVVAKLVADCSIFVVRSNPWITKKRIKRILRPRC